VQETKRRSARGWERKKANHDTYEEILEAAAKAFSKNGFDGTSLADIAGAVGIKPPALYYYFKSKSEILFAYLVRSGERILEPVQQTVAASDPDAASRLHAFVTAYVQAQLHQLETMPTVNSAIYGGALQRALTHSQQQWVNEWGRKILGILRDILEQGRTEGVFEFNNLAATTFHIHGSIDSIVNWYRPHGELSASEVAEEFARLALASVTRR
jgi:AcrR family transcriptional regulator